MPLLGPADPLPHRPRRVLVNGTSGAGKTTTAVAIGAGVGLPHIELDALHHGPGCVPRPQFADDVAALAASDAWVTEWQYGAVRPPLLARPDLMVWVDPTVPVVMRQVTRRTVGRRVRRTLLWNGNVEAPLRAVLTDPDHIVRWAWRTRHLGAERVAQVLRERPDLPVVRLRSRRDRNDWLVGPLAAAVGRDAQ